MRGVGGNGTQFSISSNLFVVLTSTAWRTSHNPPEEVLLDLADRCSALTFFLVLLAHHNEVLRAHHDEVLLPISPSHCSTLSHAAYTPCLCLLRRRLGIVILDENRVLASQQDCVGLKCQNVPSYLGDPVSDSGALALRDRNHASVFAYSLCNEAGCGDGSLLNNDTVVLAKQAMYTNDGSRVVGANMLVT